MTTVSKENVSQVAVEFVKREKNTERIDITVIEEQSDGWMVRGSCPIDLQGHPWVEKFAVLVDWKGKIKNISYGLL